MEPIKAALVMGAAVAIKNNIPTTMAIFLFEFVFTLSPLY